MFRLFFVWFIGVSWWICRSVCDLYPMHDSCFQESDLIPTLLGLLVLSILTPSPPLTKPNPRTAIKPQSVLGKIPQIPYMGHKQYSFLFRLKNLFFFQAILSPLLNPRSPNTDKILSWRGWRAVKSVTTEAVLTGGPSRSYAITPNKVHPMPPSHHNSTPETLVSI